MPPRMVAAKGCNMTGAKRPFAGALLVVATVMPIFMNYIF
jgi:hypothetical protein